jgi:hypothetical protein
MYCPMPIYVYSQPAIDTCNANTISSNAKHIAVPILFDHEQIKKNKIELRKIATQLNLADSGTKSTPAATFFCQFNYCIGVRFYPPPDSEHYRLLELHEFKPSPYDNAN